MPTSDAPIASVNPAPQLPVLELLRQARQQRDAADRMIRLLLAYGRECMYPRPYRLSDLAEASGMSISGVRIAYGPTDVAAARHMAKRGAF
jgi:hypothetical protein